MEVTKASGQGKPRLVIVGSGWAGFYLSSNLSLTQYAITIISPRRTSAYTPLLASAATGIFNFYLAEDSVRSKSRPAVRFLKANVLDVSFPTKTIQCAPAFDEDPDLAAQEFAVAYDILVLAPGCEPHTFGTPGVSEHGMFVKNVSDAMRIRKRLFDLLEKASLPNVSERAARDLLHVAVVGGGPTGIELTAELSDLVSKEISGLYPEVAGFVSISIYDVAKNILSAYDEKLHEYATGRLRGRGVEVSTGTVIEEVGRDYVQIKGKGKVMCGMLIWATGNKQVGLVERLDVELNEKGLKRVQTDDRLRVYTKAKDGSVHDGVYCLGDAGDIKGASLPTTAEVAVQKAKYLVANFNAAGTGTAFTKPFEYSQKRLISYIGQHDGVIAGKGHDHDGWTGQAAWLAWRSGSLMWNRNWRSRLAILFTWFLNLIFGTEIAKI